MQKITLILGTFNFLYIYASNVFFIYFYTNHFNIISMLAGKSFRSSQPLIVLVVIILIGFYFHGGHLNEFPSHIHAWAQSDRYALALGFVNNNLNFFKPETFTLNHQFPHDWEVSSTSSITSVDFPIHDYLPAVLMKVSGVNSPFIFRLYVLLYSFIGLIFLFKLSHKISNSFPKSLFITVFAATSPVFVYYQNGFLPTIPSLANAFIAIFFYYKHLENSKNRHFILFLLFITLAALARTTFAIPLIAVLGIEFLRAVRKNDAVKPKIAPVALSIGLLIAYFLYNRHLRELHGSIFLNEFMPPRNLQHAQELIKTALNNWEYHYFTKAHYAILAISLLISSLFIFIKKVKINKAQYLFIATSGVILFGCMLFSTLMLRQFPAHDYYFLDSFFIPIILFFISAVSFIPIKNTSTTSYIASSVIIVFTVIWISGSKKIQDERRKTGDWDKTMVTINNFREANRFLDSNGVAPTDKILVLDAHAPNIPFILMKRKGYAGMSTRPEIIEEMLDWDYNYLVYQNDYFLSDIYASYPEIINRVRKIAYNGQITLCKKWNQTSPLSLEKYLGFDEKIAAFTASYDFEDEPDKQWRNTTISTTQAYAGKRSSELTSSTKYGATYQSTHIPELKQQNRILFLNTKMLAVDEIKNCEMVVSISEDGTNTYYKSYNLKNPIQKPNQWETLSLIYQLPQVKSDNYELKIYTWNTGEGNWLMDDFEFNLY